MSLLTRETPTDALQTLLAERILLLDGAMGSLIMDAKPTEADYRGERFKDHSIDLKNANDILVLTQPGIIEDIHRRYYEAGSDIVETNTFNANVISMEEFGLEDLTYEINRRAAELARGVAEHFTALDPDRPRFVAGSMGPTKVTLSMSQDVEDPGARTHTYDQMVDSYYEQIRGLIDGGCDILLPETSFDTLTMKACLFAIAKYFGDNGIEPGSSNAIPVMISGTIFDGGKTLTAQSIEAFFASVAHFPSLTVGFNCALGPKQMRPYVEQLVGVSDRMISCYPNAGMPDGMGGFDSNPNEVGDALADFARQGWVNIVGGCCGTTPEYIATIREKVDGIAPRNVEGGSGLSTYAGLDPLVIRPDSTFLMVGERTNVTGSRKFARLIREEKYDEAVEVARQQVEGGANMIDVNMDEGLIDSEAAMTRYLNLLAAESDVSTVPFMIDSSKFSVIEAGLKCTQGKAVVNSISLKEGEEDFLDKARTIRRYGAAVVVMAFDEQGQAAEADDKVRICKRAYDLLTREIGFPPEDIIFDPNIFAVATGIDEHRELRRRLHRRLLKHDQARPCPGVRCRLAGSPTSPSPSAATTSVREAMQRGLSLPRHQGRASTMGIVNAGQIDGL